MKSDKIMIPTAIVSTLCTVWAICDGFDGMAKGLCLNTLFVYYYIYYYMIKKKK